MSTHADLPRWNRSLPDDNSMHKSKAGFALKNMKRRRGRDDESYAQPRQMAEFPRNKLKSIQERRIKKARTPSISGQALPVARLVEVMDYDQLRNVLEVVMAQHPEVALTIQKSAPKPSTEVTIELIKHKFAEISGHLPYKCDVESDYSYIRVKPYLTEFLNCISDFILNLLPPMESVFATSCSILNTITTLIHDLPNFSNNEYQYTREIAYQQLANLWLILFSRNHNDEDAEDKASQASLEQTLEWLKTVESMKLPEQMEKHNEQSNGKFTAVVDYIRNELGEHAPLNNSCSPGAVAPAGSIFNDLITVDYLNYSIATNTSR